MRLAAFLFLALAGCVHAQIFVPVDWPEVAVHGEKPPGVSLVLGLPKDHFYQGEVIPATFTFLNTSKASFHLWIGNYDRSGRIPDIRLAARDSSGKPVTDPLAWYFRRGGMGGGLGNEQDLGTWAITLPANQWLRFDHPGTYTIVAWSDRVQKGTGETRAQQPVPIELVSNPVQVTIDPLPAAQAKRIVDDAAQTINAAKGLKRPTPYNRGIDEDVTRKEQAASSAITVLRYLGTPESRAQLRQVLSWPDPFEAFAGILAAPDPSTEAALLLEDVKAGRVTLNAQVVEMYGDLRNPSEMNLSPQSTQAEITAARQKYFADIKAARAEILAAGQSAVARTGSSNLDLIWTTYQTDMSNAAARAEVVKHQLEFSPEQKRGLLFMAREPSDGHGDPADFLPVVRQAAGPPNYLAEALPALAKLRPDEAKALIVHDVVSGELHYLKNDRGFMQGPQALLCLPPGPIPELEQPVRTLLASGVTTFYEIGPGRVLAGLMKRIDRKADIRNVGA